METCIKGLREKVTNTLVDCEVMEKYLLVEWPEIQMFMDHQGDQSVYSVLKFLASLWDSTYAVPESIYNEIMSL